MWAALLAGLLTLLVLALVAWAAHWGPNKLDFRDALLAPPELEMDAQGVTLTRGNVRQVMAMGFVALRRLRHKFSVTERNGVRYVFCGFDGMRLSRARVFDFYWTNLALVEAGLAVARAADGPLPVVLYGEGVGANAALAALRVRRDQRVLAVLVDPLQEGDYRGFDRYIRERSKYHRLALSLPPGSARAARQMQNPYDDACLGRSEYRLEEEPAPVERSAPGLRDAVRRYSWMQSRPPCVLVPGVDEQFLFVSEFVPGTTVDPRRDVCVVSGMDFAAEGVRQLADLRSRGLNARMICFGPGSTTDRITYYPCAVQSDLYDVAVDVVG